MCICETKKPLPGEFTTSFCVQCGRVWVDELRRTDRFIGISKPMGGVWIGPTFFKDKAGLLANALSRVNH